MMNYDTIRVEAENNIVLLTLNRPEVLNALNSQMRGEIADAARQAPALGRVLVITGEGDNFCSGQDLGDRVRPADADLERTITDEYFPMLRAIRNLEIPVISAVNGAAAGAGANLALAADVVIAAESAYFMQAFTRIGLIPDGGGTWLIPRRVGAAKAMGMMLFGDRIPAIKASEMGLIWEAVADDEFVEYWRSKALILAAGPTEAYKRIKSAVKAGFTNNFDAQIVLEARLQGEVGKTRDFHEGMLAFLEGRKPEFEGR